MSQLGQSSRFHDARVTSAFLPIAALQRTSLDFAFVPTTDLPASIYLLDISRLPFLVEVRLSRTIEAKAAKPATARHGAYPVKGTVRTRGSEIKVGRAVWVEF